MGNSPDYQLILYSGSEELIRGFCQALAEKIKNLADQQARVHLCLSGGNSPKAVFALLAREYSSALPWQQLHFYWSDERCVPPEHSDSNYGVARQLLLDPLKIQADHIHYIDGSRQAETEAQRYAEELKRELPETGGSSVSGGLPNTTGFPDSEGLPRFDLLILGLGEDGHTASIFPHNLALLKDKRLCLVTEHPLSGQKRISLGGGPLNNAANTWFLISGKSKAGVFKQILQNEPAALQYPAFHIRPAAGNLIYFADQEAIQ
ncbi:MAG: 6-phosphogluconolactonase [Bacteroidales bacterium]|nr:6-phosphogluconolactonase [Bacteroidales bacterium]